MYKGEEDCVEESGREGGCKIFCETRLFHKFSSRIGNFNLHCRVAISFHSIINISLLLMGIGSFRRFYKHTTKLRKIIYEIRKRSGKWRLIVP